MMDRKWFKSKPWCADCRCFEDIGHRCDFYMRHVETKASDDLSQTALRISKAGWWWRGGDLNSRPIDYESIALTN